MNKLNEAINNATSLSKENKCNFVVVTIRHRYTVDKESCWRRDGEIGTLVKLIEYEPNM